MRWLAIAGLLLIIASCYLDGTRGELGGGTFYYYCVGSGDPYCDCEEFSDFCSSWSDHPIEGSWSDHVMPEAVAVGSRFSVQLMHSEDDPVELQVASPELIRQDGDEFEALRAGWVALLGSSGTRVIDFIHVRVLTPSRVRIDRLDAWSKDIQQLELPVGESAWLRAIPVVGSILLHGALDVSWSSGEATAVALLSDRQENVIEIAALAPGSAVIDVRLGQYQGQLALTVPDASALGEGEDE